MSQVVAHAELLLFAAERVEESPQALDRPGPELPSELSLDPPSAGPLRGEILTGPRGEGDHPLSRIV
jgi:hypothetical protein